MWAPPDFRRLWQPCATSKRDNFQKGRIVVRIAVTSRIQIFVQQFAPSAQTSWRGELLYEEQILVEAYSSYNNLPLLQDSTKTANFQKGRIVVQIVVTSRSQLFIQQFAPSACSCRRGELLYKDLASTSQCYSYNNSPLLKIVSFWRSPKLNKFTLPNLTLET